MLHTPIKDCIKAETILPTTTITAPAVPAQNTFWRSAIVDDDTFTHGDFTLVSSDGVRFKIPSHELFAAIPVLHGVSSTRGDAQLIEFDDDDIETAQVLHMFLSLATRSELGEKFTPNPTEHSNVFDLMPLLSFLRKYCSERVLACTMSVIVKLVATGTISAETGLVVACAMEDVDAAIVALNTLARAHCTPFAPYPDYVNGFKGENRHVRTQRLVLPFALWGYMSPKFAWALMHSRNPIKGTIDTAMFRALIANGDGDERM